MPDRSQISLMQAAAEGVRAPLSPPTLAGALGAAPAGAERPYDIRGVLVRRLLLATDVVALACAFAVAELTGRLSTGGGGPLGRDLPLLLAIPAWIVLALSTDLYDIDTRRRGHTAADELMPIIRLTALWSWGLLLVGRLAGLSIAVPRVALLWLGAVLFLAVMRAVARAWSRRQPWYVQNVIVVGTIEEAGTLVSRIMRHSEYGMRVLAAVEAGQSNWSNGARSIGSVPVIRGEVDVVELLGELEVHRVILAPSAHRLREPGDVLAELQDMAVHVDIVPSWCGVAGSRVELHELEGMPLITVPYIRLARSRWLIKRALDFTVAGVSLFLLLPMLLMFALAIKLDSRGPVLFRQRRVGRGDRRFELFKFRSMRSDAEAVKQEVAELNFRGDGNGHGMFKIAGDPRITRVGRLLRRYSLDELPQLINVLKGDMSLVGPRPLIENEDAQIVGRHRRRIDLTPGLTGLWQVNGRSDIPFEGMIDLDYLYVTNWSLWGDVKLIMRTFAAVARGRGAY